MRSRFSLVLVLLVLAACGDGYLVGTRFDATLRWARARWANAHVDSYAITVHRLCFCTLVEPVRVTVRDGVVVSRVIVATGAALPAQLVPYYPDVPGLFAVIDQARASADDLETQFDENYGFPSTIDIDWNENAVDDEVTYRMEGFAPLPEFLERQR